MQTEPNEPYDEVVHCMGYGTALLMACMILETISLCISLYKVLVWLILYMIYLFSFAVLSSGSGHGFYVTWWSIIIPSPTYSCYSLSYSLTHSLAHLLTHLLIHSLSYSHTHSLFAHLPTCEEIRCKGCEHYCQLLCWGRRA